MAGQDPSPQTTLLVLLGASSWPFSELAGSTAFEYAARDLRTYFLSDPNGFHLPQNNVLDLFNSDDSNTDILNQISDFLSDRIARGEQSNAGVKDVFTYYIGHGGITTDSSTFYLAIRRTRQDYEKATSIAIDDLAERLKKGARFQRRILILDCCFAARAMRFLLQGSAPAALMREKTVAAFKEIDLGVGIPSRGTSFLASSGKDVASVILPDESSTMFTSALLSALRTGDPFQEREQLTLSTVYRLTADFLRRTHRDSFPQPELHSPDQSEGDIATTIALFPNPCAEEIRARRVEDERRRLAEEAEQTRRMEEEKQRRIEEERARQAEEERLRKDREEEQASLVKPEPKRGPVVSVSETTETNQAQQPTEVATPVPVIPLSQQQGSEVSATKPAQSQPLLPLSGRERLPQPAYSGISRRTVTVGLAALSVVSVAGGGLLWLTHSHPPAAPTDSSTSTSTPTSLSLGTTLYTYQAPDRVRTVAWSPDGSRIASGTGDNTVQVWDAMDGGHAYIYRGHAHAQDAVTTVAWSPDGSRIASGSDDGTVQVWDASTRSRFFTFKGNGGSVESVAWAPDGSRIAFGSNDGTVQVWDVFTGSRFFTYTGHHSVVWSVTWSPDGSRIVSGSGDKTVQVWNALDGSQMYTYRRHSAVVNAVAWSPHSSRIASAGGYPDDTVQVWNAGDGSNVYTYRRHTRSIFAVPWSPDGRRIASGSWDNTVQVWNAVDGSQVYTYREQSGGVNAVAWSPDGKHIASGSNDSKVQVWQAS